MNLWTVIANANDITVWQSLYRIVSLQDYNTRVVLLGTGLLGTLAGLVGSFALLRKRALLGDALSHATLPGIALAFLLANAWGFHEKSLGILLVGAAISGILGTVTILLIRRYTRLYEDTAMGIVLSVFFGLGVVLLGLVQQTPGGNAAGLETFIYGRAASISQADVQLIAVVGLVAAALVSLGFKELTLLCFDETYAATRGYRVWLLDLSLMTLMVLVTIVGLQSVGLILMIALLVIPPAAARFWTDRLPVMVFLAMVFGATSCLLGAIASGLYPRLPSGAMMVLAAAGCFGVSLLFGYRRGIVWDFAQQLQYRFRTDRQHLLRALFEQLEIRDRDDSEKFATTTDIPESDLLAMRSWSSTQLRRSAWHAAQAGLVVASPPNQWRLTISGYHAARKLVHDHRLLELYLIRHADIAPSRVDQDADAIEHWLEPAMIAELEAEMSSTISQQKLPASPHPVVPTITPGDDALRNRNNHGQH